ncbi:hypothetical protein J2S36_000692 [Arcanobacterium hippocoleae]|uniref:Uncharacterized protein n=1 Tax=Arcanobacterium hippocoleae TaxID=149017 RepID=A0ABU1T1A9_9ACTO|nr:hypothetical protein [Arcanobacterium hippocoleae]
MSITSKLTGLALVIGAVTGAVGTGAVLSSGAGEI